MSSLLEPVFRQSCACLAAGSHRAHCGQFFFKYFKNVAVAGTGFQATLCCSSLMQLALLAAVPSMA